MGEIVKYISIVRRHTTINRSALFLGLIFLLIFREVGCNVTHYGGVLIRTGNLLKHVRLFCRIFNAIIMTNRSCARRWLSGQLSVVLFIRHARLPLMLRLLWFYEIQSLRIVLYSVKFRCEAITFCRSLMGNFII